MSKGFITGTNEELIKAYKESRDESYLKELIEANKGLINLWTSVGQMNHTDRIRSAPMAAVLPA